MGWILPISKNQTKFGLLDKNGTFDIVWKSKRAILSLRFANCVQLKSRENLILAIVVLFYDSKRFFFLIFKMDLKKYIKSFFTLIFRKNCFEEWILGGAFLVVELPLLIKVIKMMKNVAHFWGLTKCTEDMLIAFINQT